MYSCKKNVFQFFSKLLVFPEPVTNNEKIIKGGVDHFFFKFVFVSLCSLYVCRLCINYQDLRTNLLGVGALRILFLTFISHFVIDFLSIRKVIIFSAIATDDRHPLRSRSIHQNAANCMTIRFRYIAQLGGKFLSDAPLEDLENILDSPGCKVRHYC